MNVTDSEGLCRIEELKGQSGVVEQTLQLLKDLLRARIEAAERIVVKPLPAETVLARLNAGEPAVRMEELDIFSPEMQDHSGNVAAILGKHDLLNGAPTDLGALVREYDRTKADLSGEEGAVRSDAMSQYMLWEVLKPAYRKYREVYLPLLPEEHWLHPWCPVCGSPPILAKRMGESGRRFLCCGVCDFSWRYVALQCPFCGNERQETLVSFDLAEGDRYGVNGCRSCNRYVKVVELRDGPSTDVFVELEDILSFRLDVAAVSEGFQTD